MPGLTRRLPKRIYAVSILICLFPSLGWSQGEAEHLGEVLKDEIVSPAVADFQMRQHIVQATAPLPTPLGGQSQRHPTACAGWTRKSECWPLPPTGAIPPREP